MITSIDAKDSLGSNVHEMSDTTKMNQDELLRSMIDEEIRDLRDMTNLNHIYARLVESIVFNVYDHDIIKKRILLQLMNGVYKVISEDIHLHGDINVCIVKKKKTKVQYDKYVQMMNLIIRRLNENERNGKQGIEHDELII